MIKKTFELSEIKKVKGKIKVDVKEITTVSNYIKTESSNLIVNVLETKLVNSNKIGKVSVESQVGGANE